MKRFCLIASMLFLAVGLSAADYKVSVFPDEVTGPVKPMNAVNNGPIISNLYWYKMLHIPFCRTHDSATNNSYGGKNTVDITAIFPDFDADVDDPKSYHFTETDNYFKVIADGGSKILYRLGQTIENNKMQPIKKGCYPPKDFKKWARICEHIVRHYNEGWADGFHYDIPYWEIWNEPNLDIYQKHVEDDPKAWAGTVEQFAELYAVATRHLKKCFPHLKIGGPALSGLTMADEFLGEIAKRKGVMDFFSYHCYGKVPEKMGTQAVKAQELLEKYGYKGAETILDEWNYVRRWHDTPPYSAHVRMSEKGAAYVISCMCVGQASPVDMLMYYDFRPTTTYNAVFDRNYYTPMKTFYSFYAWRKLADLGTAVRVEKGDAKGIYTAVAKGANGKIGVIVAYYSEDDNECERRTVKVSIPGLPEKGEAFVQMTDYERSFTEFPCSISKGCINIPLYTNSFAYIEL